MDINITNAGTGYNADSILVIEDPRGINGSLLPILGGGTLTLKATLQLHGLETSVNVLASSRNKLSSREKWLDQYLDSFSQMENAYGQTIMIAMVCQTMMNIKWVRIRSNKIQMAMD